MWNFKKLGPATAALVAFFALAGSSHAQDRPNIVIIWGDDIGYWN
jgi:hypothetical protein